MTSITDRLAQLAVALPATLLIAATAVMLGGLPFGIDPLWRVEPLTLAEAAALRDNGEVVRLVRSGQDPNRPATVRAEVLGDREVTATPLEAAVGIDRADIIQVLLENGATLDVSTWPHLMCLAASVEADEAKEFLEQRRPDDAVAADCEHAPRPW